MESVIGFTALTLGGLWVWSTLKGRSLWKDTIAVLRGEPLAETPVRITDAGGGGDFPDASETQPTPDIEGTVPTTPGIIRVSIGQGSYWLNPTAAASFRSVETRYGKQIQLVSAGRTRQEQIDLRRKNGCPDVFNSPSSACKVPTARPGTSQHEFGNAVDVHANMRSDPRLIDAFSKAGWCRYNPRVEPWHWAYRECK